jgi:phosphoribosyl-AMP cyclohydrolase / phosphoribosyl-ATP pyrophosphohydrolase
VTWWLDETSNGLTLMNAEQHKAELFQNIKFDQHGLIPAIVQDAQTREVLTLAYMNAESLDRTIETRQTWFWSRSRNELWHKGETSGNTQQVVDLMLDCDGDAIIVFVNPAGPACHRGTKSCFNPELQSPALVGVALGPLLDQLYRLIENRQRERPVNSYTTYLFDEGIDKILKKLGEESTETIVAAKNEAQAPLVAEVSDLLYHLIVLLVARGVGLEAIAEELARRRARGGSE